jgi:hypothetical protein
VLFNILLIGRLGAVGIALSTSLTLALWLGLVWTPFRREMAARGVARPLDAAPVRFLARSLLAALAAAAAAWGVTLLVPGDTMAMRLARLGAAGTAGLGAYGLGLMLLRVEEAGAAARLLGRRLGLGGAAP